MIVNGIDLDGLGAHAPSLSIPDTVKGRVVHIDADFLAYQTTATKAEGDDRTFDDMKHNASVAVQTIKDMAGAQHVHLHVTPSGSDKGKRYEIAILKEYQGNRADKEKPKYLNLMRQWLVKEYNGTLHQFCEADDGMSAHQYRAIKEGNRNLSIIASKDKDLSMVPGLHLDWDTGEIINADDFGSIWMDDTKSTKKLKGFGWKFFWAQMLMGDTADNISGLPLVHARVHNKLKPTADTAKHQKILDMHPGQVSPAARATAEAYLSNRHAKCGPAMAKTLLDRANDNKAAFQLVRGLYSLAPEPYKHWKTGEEVPWQKAFLSEAQLLWMRREETNENDVAFWMKEHCVA